MRRLNACIGAVALVGALALATAPAGANGPAEDPFAGNACVQCHRDLPGRSNQIVDVEWRHSVHYTAKVGCEGCHGGNAALRREQFNSAEDFKRASHLERNPDALVIRRDAGFVSAARGRSVSYLCGKCHMEIKEHHLGSPHGEFGDPSCLYCHGQGTHAIANPTLEIIDLRNREEGGRCRVCHRSGTMEAVATIKRKLLDTEERIKTSGEQYKLLESWDYRNLELEKLHHHAAEVRSQLRRIFHSLNMREIANFAGEVDAVADRTTASFELVQRLRRTQRQQTTVGLLAVLFLLGFAGTLIYYKNSILGHGSASEAAASPTAEARGPAAPPEAGATAPAAPSQAGATAPAAPPPAVSREAGPSPAAPFPARPRQRAAFVWRGSILAFIHFWGTLVWMVTALFLDRPDGAVAAAHRVHRAVGHVFGWPVSAVIRSVMESTHPVLLWPSLLANSALWGFAVAAVWELVKRIRIDRRK